MKPIAILILASILSGPVAAAQLYRWVDDKGRVEWRDTPPPSGSGAKNVQQRNVGGSTIETSTLPYSVQVAAKNFPVTLWTAKCGAACDQAKAHLVRRGVPYAEKDAQADVDAFEKLTGGTEVPVLYVGRTQIKGYEASVYDSALNTAGYPSSAPPGTKPQPAAKAATPAPKDKPAATAAATPAAKPAAKAAADELPVVRLFTHPQCTPCTEARALLASRGVSFSEVSADTAQGLAELEKLTGAKNVPVLFVGTTMVNGYADTNFHKALDDAGFPRQ
jgi:glutaredoxin